MSEILHLLNLCVLFPITVLCRILLCVIVMTVIHRIYVRKKKIKNVAIVVLGDIGRSPRMTYHALSLADNGFNVHIIGFAGSNLHQKIMDSQSITVHFLRQENLSCNFPKTLAYFVKVIMQTCVLLYTIATKVPACEDVLVQNPPCIPSLLCCWVISIWNGSWFIIDWHNYGYTILSLNLGKGHMLVRLAHFYEKIFGHLSSANLCVTKAMQKDLLENWNINATVLYDRPPDRFKPLGMEEQHKVLCRLSKKFEELKDHNDERNSVFTSVGNNGDIIKPKSRPIFLVSSTSWTEDEDFSILLEAFDNYDSITESKHLPQLICAITGKGPLKEYYLDIIKQRKWKNIKVFTPWLEPDDYPLLVACADLGISLHTSSSGVDLPMKVVDMFGCHVPVAAISFTCLHELVKDGTNGVVFENSEDLCETLVYLFQDYSENQDIVLKFKKNLKTFTDLSWSENWNKNVLPLFTTHTSVPLKPATNYNQ